MKVFSIVASTLGKIAKRAERYPILMLFLGFAIGALTNIYPVPAAIGFGTIALMFLFPVVRDEVRSRQLISLTEWEKSLLQPDPQALSQIGRVNEHYLVIGQSIETIPHPNINSRGAVHELGWDPSDVDLLDLQEQFDASEVLRRSGGHKEFDPPNGIKFCLTDTSFITKDSPHLALSLKTTDYFTLKSILIAIRENPPLRMELGNLTPMSNQIPHSLCLHFIVRFVDGDVLCMQRDRKAAYHGNLWSFSGEEQLSPEDIKYQRSALSLFQRALCEEVYALREDTPLEDRWNLIAPHVRSMGLWSVFIEEGLFNFSLLAVFQLNETASQFVATHNNLIDKGSGSRDLEGAYYLATPESLHSLLCEGKCTVSALFTNRNQELHDKDLHPTSRYRIFRLIRAVNRKPLAPNE